MTDEYQEIVLMRLFQLTCEGDVLVFTGLENWTKKKVMTYSDGSKTTLNPRQGSCSIELAKDLLSSPLTEFNKITLVKLDPKHKLTLGVRVFSGFNETLLGNYGTLLFVLKFPQKKYHRYL